MQTVIDRSTAELSQVRSNRRETVARVAAMNEAAFQHALITLQMCIKSEGHAVQVLHGISSALAKTAPRPNSDLAESIGWIDELADQIKYRNQP